MYNCPFLATRAVYVNTTAETSITVIVVVLWRWCLWRDSHYWCYVYCIWICFYENINSMNCKLIFSLGAFFLLLLFYYWNVWFVVNMLLLVPWDANHQRSLVMLIKYHCCNVYVSVALHSHSSQTPYAIKCQWNEMPVHFGIFR